MDSRTSNSVEELIIDVSLQHPEFGARRLIPLLKEEEIVLSVSAVYNILKRNGLNTRAKRLAKFGQRKVPDSKPTRKGDLPFPGEEKAPAVETAAVITASSRVFPGHERHRSSAGRSRGSSDGAY